MRPPTLLLWMLSIAALGCAASITAPVASNTPTPVIEVTPAPRVVLWHVPGISGQQRLDDRFLANLAPAIHAAEVKFFDWPGKSHAGLNSLLNFDRARQRATDFAAELTEFSEAHPRDHIILTCHSGGAGLTAWALEQVPQTVRVSQWILIAPALSPGYDLTCALARVDHAVAYVSKFDTVLGPGTRNFGTIDRVRTDAAGRVGFARAYPNLVEIPYDQSFMKFDHPGDHIGALFPRFATQVIAPRIKLNQTAADSDR